MLKGRQEFQLTMFLCSTHITNPANQVQNVRRATFRTGPYVNTTSTANCNSRVRKKAGKGRTWPAAAYKFRSFSLRAACA